MPIAIMPRDMTLEKSLSAVFFTVPLRVTKKTYSLLFLQIAHRQEGFHGFARLQCNQVADVFALAGSTDVGDLVHLQPVHASRVGEHQQVVVRD